MIVGVQLLRDSWLWGWEIRIADDGSLIESSWTSTWTAFATYEEALAARRRRLAELEETKGPRGRACAA